MQHHSLFAKLQDESKGENVEKMTYFSFKKKQRSNLQKLHLLWKTFHLLHSLRAGTNFSIRNHFGTDQNRLSHHYNSI
jgi:hypothetical protein